MSRPERLGPGPRPGLPAAAVLASVLALAGCNLLSGGGIETGNPDTKVVDGGGIETGNTGSIAGRILAQDGSALPRAQVTLSEVVLAPDGVSHPRIFTVATDTAGNYQFPPALPHGRYALFVPGEGETRMVALQPRLSYAGGETKLADLTVAGVTRLEGRVIPGPGMRVEDLLACIPGAQICVVPGPDSVYTFPAAPQGAYEIVFLGAGAAHYLAMDVSAQKMGTLHLRDVVLGDSVPGARVPYAFYDASRLGRSLSVIPVEYPAGLEPAWYADKDFSSVNYLLLNDGRMEEMTTLHYFDQWRHRREIPGTLFADSARGARLGGFPVPIRLRAADATPSPAYFGPPGVVPASSVLFDFSQARPDGGDLIISDGAGRLLPHEIERWDAAAGKADIWVRIDSLPLPEGRNLVLHWGRDEAMRLAGGAGVFRAEDGFIGVWHLADRTPDNLVLDSRGRFHGFAVEGWQPDWGQDSVRAGEAIIAGGHRLGHSGALVHVNHQVGLDVTHAFTLSVWARSWRSEHDQVLAAKTGQGKHEWRFRILDDGTLDLEFGGPGGRPVGSVTTVYPVQRQDTWRLYSATFDHGLVRLFLDGEEVPTRVRYGFIPRSVLPQAAELRLGSDGNMMVNWRGSLDDFSYYSVPKSPDWIRTLYRSQRL